MRANVNIKQEVIMKQSQKFFFDSPGQLAQMFTQPNHHNPETQGKYLPSGLKPIEEFESDISYNLVAWSLSGNTILYMTENFWYEVWKEEGVIKLSRHGRGQFTRMDTWMNLHSCSIGKKFLKDKKDLFIPAFNSK